jgi:hypothetical protein
MCTGEDNASSSPPSGEINCPPPLDDALKLPAAVAGCDGARVGRLYAGVSGEGRSVGVALGVARRVGVAVTAGVFGAVGAGVGGKPVGPYVQFQAYGALVGLGDGSGWIVGGFVSRHVPRLVQPANVG